MDWPSPVTLIVLSALIAVIVVASMIIQPNSTHIIIQQALKFLPTTQLAPILETCVNHTSTRFFVKLFCRTGGMKRSFCVPSGAHLFHFDADEKMDKEKARIHMTNTRKAAKPEKKL